MAISLTKGGNINLSKSAPGMTKVVLGLGWDARITDGQPFDLDASAFLLKGEKVRSEQDFIYYNQPSSPDGAVAHSGDATTGIESGDDERITVELTRVPADVEKIAFTVTIHEAETRRQTFGMVNNAFIRVVDAANNNELARYDLSEDYSTETAMIFGELYRHSGEWKFKAIGQGFAGGLAATARAYGLNV